MSVPKISNPTDEDINIYHHKFMVQLQTLFDEYKYQYDARGQAAELIIE